jgi:hypothetical protein
MSQSPFGFPVVSDRPPFFREDFLLKTYENIVVIWRETSFLGKKIGKILKIFLKI